MKYELLLVAAAFTLFFSAACGEADQIVDCTNICEHEVMCVPALDFNRCFDSCEELPNSEADLCDSCQDTRGCGNCARDCAGLVLVSP